MRRYLTPLLLCFILLAVQPIFALWKTMKTESFVVFYPQGSERRAREILEVLEHYREYCRELVGGNARRVAVVLEDAGIESGGLTDIVNRRILLFQFSPSTGEIGFHENWWRLVGVHEYTHWQHLSSRQGVPAVLTALFGNQMATGNYTPRWLKEGIAVVAESGTSPFEGRLNEGFFDAYTMVLAGKGSLPSIVQATFDVDTFPGGRAQYLFGAEFVAFLSRKYGEEQLARFFMHYGASILSYLSPVLPAAGLDRSARKVFGQSIRSLWLEWQLEAMKQNISFTPSEEPLTRDGWWLDNPVAWEGAVYYQRSYPRKAAAFSTEWRQEIVRFDPDSGKQKVLVRSTAPFSGPLRIRAGRLYYAVQDLERGHRNRVYKGFGVTVVLYSRDLAGSRSRRILREALRSFEVLEDGTILVIKDRSEAFGSEIWLHEPAAGSSTQLLVSDYLVAEITADGPDMYVSARRDWNNFQLYRVELPGWRGAGSSLAGVADVHLKKLTGTSFQEGEICLAGGRLFYSANYGGRRSLYEYDVSSQSVLRVVAADFARAPAWDEQEGKLYYLGLNAGGYDLYREKLFARSFDRQAVEHDGQGRETAGLSPIARLPEEAIRAGGYGDNLITLLPRALFPVFSLDLYLGTYRAGARTTAVSALGDFSYTVLGYYDSASEQTELEATLQSKVLAPLTAILSFYTPAEDDVDTLSATLDFPLYLSLRSGLSHVVVGATGTLQWGEYASRGVEPFVGIGLQAPSSSLALQLGFPWKRIDRSAGVADRYALTAWGLYSLTVVGCRFTVQALGLYDLQGLFWRLPAPRAYADGLTAGWGGLCAVDLSIPLVRLRGGLWNPGIYFGDLFLVPFTDAAFNEAGELQLSFGGVLQLEGRAGAIDRGFPFAIVAGYAANLEGLPTILLGINFPGLMGEYLRGWSRELTAARASR